MELEEYDDELPPISVNSSKLDESVFAMPPAEVLASQRARAEECERELLRLREHHEQQDSALKAAVNTVTIAPSRSNSSGSEGETALVSAVEALRVGSAVVAPGPGPESAPGPGAGAAPWPGAALRGVGALCAAYGERAGSADADALTDDIITSIWSWLSGLESESERGGRRAPSDDEVVDVGAWLCACVVRDVPAARARRALHALLAAASEEQAGRLARTVLPALGGARGLLGLSVALGGAGPLAHALHRAALARLLRGDRDRWQVSTEPLTTLEICELVSLGWRAVPARERDVAMQLLGRALLAARLQHEREHAEHAGHEHAEREHAARARALATLAQPCGDHADKHHPDQLKVAVAASKLKILLSDRN